MKLSFLKKILLIITTGLLAGYFCFLFGKISLIIIIGAIITFFIFQKPVRGIYLIALALPFERIGSFDIKGLTIRPSQIIMLITILAWIFLMLKNKKISLKKNTLYIPLLLFLIINLISLINSPNLIRSSTVFCFTAFVLFLAILIPNLITKKEHLKRIILFLFLGCLIVTIFGLFQFIGDVAGLSTSLTGLREQYTKEILGFTRVQSTALEPLYFANYLLIPLILSIVLLITKNYQLNYFKQSKGCHSCESRNLQCDNLVNFTPYRFRLKAGMTNSEEFLKNTLPPTILILSSINLILTVSRGAYIAFGAALLLIIIIYFKKLFNLKNILFLSLLIIIIGSVSFYNNSNILNKFFTHSTNLFSGSAWTERMDNFSLAINTFKAHPIIGNGVGSYGPLVSDHPHFPGSKGWKIVNNEYLELLTEVGILGLTMFIIIIITLFILSIKSIKKSADPFLKVVLIGFLISLIAILFQYNTFSILYLMHVWFAIGMILAIKNINWADN